MTKVRITAVEPAVGEKMSFKASVPETASTEVYEVHWAGEFDNERFVQGNDYTITVKLRIKASSSNNFAASSQINATDHKDLLAYLKKKLPDAEIWLGGAYASTKRMPTETEDGHVSMQIGIKCDGVTLNSYYFVVALPAINKSPDAANLNADIALMKTALQDLTVTSKTTGDDVLKAINTAAVHGSKAVWDKNYRYVASTKDIQGSITGNLIVALGDKKDIINVLKTLPIAGSSVDAKIDADRSALSKALRTHGADNSTTQEELLKAAHASMQNGSSLTLTGYTKTDATYDKEGKIVMDFELKLKDKTRISHNVIRMSKLRAKLPFGVTVNQDEWEILRLTNIERHKVGSVDDGRSASGHRRHPRQGDHDRLQIRPSASGRLEIQHCH